MNDFVRLEMVRQETTDLSSTANPRILAIGDVTLWRRGGGEVPRHRGLSFQSIDDVTEETLLLLQPDLIVSPAVTPEFDCLEVAFRLASLRYQGCYRVLAQDMPKPAIIRNEIRAFCPDLDFDIVAIPPATSKLA